MMQDRGDLYGKLDAIFEKRSTDGLVDRSLGSDDFPELTEVIPVQATEGPEPVPDLLPVDRRGDDRRAGDRRHGDRRRGDRRGDGEAGHISAGAASSVDAEVDRLIQAMEARLGELFVNHQSSVEEMVRQAIRIELTRQQSDLR